MPSVGTVFLFQAMKNVMITIHKTEMDAVLNVRQNWGTIATQTKMIHQGPRNVTMSKRSGSV